MNFGEEEQESFVPIISQEASEWNKIHSKQKLSTQREFASKTAKAQENKLLIKRYPTKNYKKTFFWIYRLFPKTENGSFWVAFMV